MSDCICTYSGSCEVCNKEQWSMGYTAGRRDERAEHIEDTNRMTRLVKQLQGQLEEAGGRLDVAHRLGRQSERAAIVAWLSGQYRTANGYFTHVITEALRNGEHLRAARTEPRHDESPPPSM